MLVKQRVKKLLTRILSFTIAIMMCATPIIEPLHAYASGNAGNAGGNTGGGTANMGASDSVLAWSSRYQGYRFYVVNANLERISEVYDFVYNTPSAGEFLMTTRFDTTKSPVSDPQTNILPIEDLKVWCESTGNVPEPTIKNGDNPREGNGAAFKNWFFNGVGGSHIPGSSPGGSTGGGGSLSPNGDADGDGIKNKDDIAPYNPTIPNTDGCIHLDVDRNCLCDVCGMQCIALCTLCLHNPCECINIFCQDCRQYPCVCQRNITCRSCWRPLGNCICCNWCHEFPCRGLDSSNPCPIYGSDTQNGSGGLGDISHLEMCPNCGNFLNSCNCNKLNFSKEPTSNNLMVQGYINTIIAIAEASKAASPSLTDKKAVKNAYESLVRSAADDGTLYGNSYTGINHEVSNNMYSAYCIVKKSLAERSIIGNFFNNLFGYSYNNDILSQNIPLSNGNADEAGEGMPAYNLINKNNTIKVEGYDNAYFALADGGYLIVEPITWLHVRKNNGSWSSPSTYSSSRVYGTYWNLANEWSGRGIGSFHSSVMTKLFNNCLTTSTLVTTKTGKTIQPIESSSQKDVSVSLDYMRGWYGLSMHIYDSSLFMDTSQTSTYDEPLGREPGKAPDDSSKLSENQKTDTNEYANIVKFYEDNGSGDKSSYTRTPTPKKITIESEQPTGYIVKEWYTSDTYKPASGSSPTYSEYKNSMDNKRRGTSTGTITLNDNETTLYVLLIKSNVSAQSDYTLYESEISKPITMGSDLSDVQIPMPMFSLEDECEWHCRHILDNCSSCDWEWDCDHNCGTRCDEAGYCVHDCSDGCKDYFCAHKRGSCGGVEGDCLVLCKWTPEDSSLHFKFKNLKVNEYNKILKTGNGFTPIMTEVDATRDKLPEHVMFVGGFDYKFVIYRGDDELNYAKYKYTESTLGFTPKDSKTEKTRKSSDYTKGIVMDFADDGCDLTTTSKGDRGCTDTEDVTLPNPTLTHQVNILVQAYSGIDRTPDASINANPRINIGTSGNHLFLGRMISTNTSIKFNPYIQMTWADMNSGKKNVQVLSEYRREILPNDYAEISWTQNDGNLLVQSQMWAVDSMLTNPSDRDENGNDKVWTGINQVLKGGASLQLKNKETQKVMISTYQTVVEDTSRNISEITGTYDLTIDKAKEYHKEFVTQAKDKLDKAELVQWVSNDNSGEIAWDSGIKVKRGGSISELDNGSSTSSTESKYYLDTDINDTSNSQRSDLDVYEVGTKTLKYRFYSDIEGNIYVKKTAANGSETISKILNKKQGVEALSGEIASINSRTYAVTKLLAALERNSGNDKTASWASDGKWYNEAYAGITVYIQHTELEVGLSVKNALNPLRLMVLDPRLIPDVSSKNDQGSTAFSSAFKVDLDQATPIAKFKNTDIFMASPDMLFNSRNIYITNMTVDDSR